MHSILITGTNRGIGLELVKHYAAEGWRVYATCREPEQALELLVLRDTYPQLSLHALDLENETEISALAEALKGQTIDILLNNAGVYASGSNRFGEVKKDIWLRALAINTVAPLLMAQAFVAHIAQSEHRIIANISSKVGSIDDNGSGGGYAYRSTKSALNQVTKSLSIDLANQGIKAVALHPGWVQTDMGGPNALITTKESVKGIASVLARLQQSDSGRFINFDGSTIPW